MNYKYDKFNIQIKINYFFLKKNNYLNNKK